MHLDRKMSSLDVEPWQLTIRQHLSDQQLLHETLLAQANGYIGTRGCYEEGLEANSLSSEGVYLNGVYQQEPIKYGENAYGYATHNQKMLQVPNGKCLTLNIDGEFLTPCKDKAEGQRTLDFHSGILHREQTWITSAGKEIQVKSRRFVSLSNPHLMAIEYEVLAVNFSGSVQLCSALDANYDTGEKKNTDDPRKGCLSVAEGLQFIDFQQEPSMNAFLHQARGTDFIIASATIDVIPSEGKLLSFESQQNNKLCQNYEIGLQQNKPIKLHKWIAYNHTCEKEKKQSSDELNTLVVLLKQAASRGFESELQEHQSCLGAFWDSADVEIVGDTKLQQGIRFNLFHVFQSAGRGGYANIGAKGLTGHGYDGHYFWDTEIYVIPSLCFTQPEIARQLILFRINTLPKARERARQMAHETGALYPWRTIGGDECSAYYPAGTAQYHINAAVAYALKTYLNATGDQQILWDGGAEMLFETARLWASLGHFNPRREGQFCIDGVTGPDEYTAVVNNNFYTNAMAQMHLRFAVRVARELELESFEQFEKISLAIQLTRQEISLWEHAAENMYLPYDAALGIHLQDDSFLDKKPWDFANTPADHYPLLLNYHPLVIYRHQVLKQADVVLGMYLLDDAFTEVQKKRNLAFYEPLTTHDSTLSSCIHSIECSETGDHQKAYDFFQDTARMDLDNNHGNSEYGVHIACMSGSWASIVHGFAGFRARDGHLIFKPYLPKPWRSYCFKVVYRKTQLSVIVSEKIVTYQLIKGHAVELHHFGQKLHLSAEQPVQGMALTPAIRSDLYELEDA